MGIARAAKTTRAMQMCLPASRVAPTLLAPISRPHFGGQVLAVQVRALVCTAPTSAAAAEELSDLYSEAKELVRQRAQ